MAKRAPAVHFTTGQPEGFGWTVCGRHHGGERGLDYVPPLPANLTTDWALVTCGSCKRGRRGWERDARTRARLADALR